MKKYLQNSLLRIIIILLGAAIQLFITLFIFRWFADKAAWINGVLQIMSIMIILGIIKNSRHLSFDIIYILLIFFFPIPGTIIYILLGADLLISPTYSRISSATKMASSYYPDDNVILKKMKKEYPEHQGQFEYISSYSGYPFYKNTDFTYYPLGEKGFPEILKELKKAKKFIFLEYFIIQKGMMWDSILEILEQKAKEGLDVRVMYDDIGSFFLLPETYYKTLEEKGIKCLPFNRVSPILNIIINHRDHRKIMVIDGKVAFSGGINLADEYINVTHLYGKWKDNVFKVKGNAVWSFTVMFLTHWNALRHEDPDFAIFREESNSKKTDGYIAPYGETPLDNENSSQNIYLNILNQAKRYCYIFTPYLIIDNEMLNALILCAKRGVDIRIVTPGIPDKKLVFQITRSFYSQLIEGGVKIIEYTPGFVHSKVFVCDDVIATVGTVNLDYRSLYLHFENGVYLYGSKKIADIGDDLLASMAEGHEISKDEFHLSFLHEFFLSVLRIFAPLM